MTDNADYGAHEPLTAEEAIKKARAIIARQSNVRRENEWADAYFDIAILLDRVERDLPHNDGSGT